MNTGQIISAAGHAGLILWALFGGTFRSAPPPFEVTEVTAISAEDYAALVAAARLPEAVADVDTLDAPEAGTAPAVTAATDIAPARSQPRTAATPKPDATPEAPTPPPAETEVADTAPVLVPPPEDTAVLVPGISDRPRPRPAPRIAPEPVARPDPEVRIDEVDRTEAAPDDRADPVEKERRQTAREQAATEIVTEAEAPEAAAPARSLRPRARPTRAAAAPEPPPAAPATAAPRVDDAAVADAIATALGGGGAAASDSPPAGPPLSAGEKDALRVAVRRCWNVGALSTEALATTVVVVVRMFEDGRPDAGSIRMTGFSGGSARAAGDAFAAARRAIIRCGAEGFDLPAEKYGQWRDIEMTFNPERMRIK